MSYQVSKTFVAKTMKIIDKDESGEVDVDEMVCIGYRLFFSAFFSETQSSGGIFSAQCRDGQ